MINTHTTGVSRLFTMQMESLTIAWGHREQYPLPEVVMHFFERPRTANRTFVRRHRKDFSQLVGVDVERIQTRVSFGHDEDGSRLIIRTQDAGNGLGSSGGVQLVELTLQVWHGVAYVVVRSAGQSSHPFLHVFLANANKRTVSKEHLIFRSLHSTVIVLATYEHQQSNKYAVFRRGKYDPLKMSKMSLTLKFKFCAKNKPMRIIA